MAVNMLKTLPAIRAVMMARPMLSQHNFKGYRVAEPYCQNCVIARKQSLSTTVHSPARYSKDAIEAAVAWNKEMSELFGPKLERNKKKISSARQSPKTGTTTQKKEKTDVGEKPQSRSKTASGKSRIEVTRAGALIEDSEVPMDAPNDMDDDRLALSLLAGNGIKENSEEVVTNQTDVLPTIIPPVEDRTTEHTPSHASLKCDAASEIPPGLADAPGLDPILLFPLFSPERTEYYNHVPPVPELYIPGQTERADHPDPFFPSVTTILSATQTPENRMVLARWRKKMIAELGEEGFKVHNQENLDRGTSFHSLVQKYLEGTPEPELDLTERIGGYWKSVQSVFSDVTEVRSLEETVRHRNLCYRGHFDCLANYKGTLCLIDWKTSKKSKSHIRYTYDYPLQMAAYMGALNFDTTYPYQVENALIVVCYEDSQPAHAHLMSRSLSVQYWGAWLHRLHQYWTDKAH